MRRLLPVVIVGSVLMYLILSISPQIANRADTADATFVEERGSLDSDTGFSDAPRPQESREDSAVADTSDESEARSTQRFPVAEEFASTWADYLSDPNPYQAALDAEDIDSNWGPLVEAAAVGAIATNDANLLTLTATCKTTICKLEVEQAGALAAGLSADDMALAILEWSSPISRAVGETGLGFWRMRLGEIDVAGEVTTWDVWILRTPLP